MQDPEQAQQEPEQPLRAEYCIKTIDLRAATGMTPHALTDAYKKLKIQFADAAHKGRTGVIKSIPGPEVRRLLKHKGFTFRPGQVVAFMMCKGGVGKSSSTVYTAQRLAAYGARVLVIDSDQQGNTTRGFDLASLKFELDPGTPVLADVVKGACTVDDAIVKVTESLHLIPSTQMNANLDGRIREENKNVSLAFKRVIKDLTHRYDYIFFDCGPSLNVTNTAAVSASNLVVLPVSIDLFSKEGLAQTLAEISTIENDFGIKVEKRILFTKFDARELKSIEHLTSMAKEHSDKTYNTLIRICSDIKTAMGKIDLYSLRGSTAKEDYDEFTRELCGMLSFFAGKKKKASAA